MLKFRCDQNVDNSTDLSDTKSDNLQYEEIEFQCHAHWIRDGGVSSLVMTRSAHLGYYCLTYSDTGIKIHFFYWIIQHFFDQREGKIFWSF